MAKILVIDEYAAVRCMIKLMLQEVGHEVETAEDALAGLQQAMLCGPDLVLLEAHLAGMDGIEMCRRLHGITGLERLPVLMMTSRPEIGQFVKAARAGAWLTLIKPFGREWLLGEVSRLLAASQYAGGR